MRAKLRRWWSLSRDLFPLRWTGMVLLALALFVTLRFSRDEGDYLLRPAGLVALVLIITSGVLVVLATLSLRRFVRAAPVGVLENLDTHASVTTGFKLPRLRWWFILDVTVEWTSPTGVAVKLEPLGAFFEEVVTPSLRGRHAEVKRRFTVEDVFGLARLSFEHEWPHALRIAPAPAPCTAEVAASRSFGDVLSNPAGRAEGDMVEMRAYGPGDSMRHILWKTWARTRRLLVRLPERSQAPQPVSVAFLVAGDGDEPSAGTARLYVEQGLLGPDFIFSADGASAPARTRDEALEQIVDSARMRSEGAGTLEGLASQIDPGRLSACLVFAPPVDGAWRPRLTGLLQRLGTSATIIIGVDLEPSKTVEQQLDTRNRLQKWFLQPEGDLGAKEVAKVRAAFEADGFKVQLVHRATGQVL